MKLPNKKAKMIWGTSHFVSFGAAVSYYKLYENEARAAVRTKIKEGSIHIGPPTLKPNQKLFVNKEEGRYFIEG